jgi:hypothetical protein
MSIPDYLLNSTDTLTSLDDFDSSKDHQALLQHSESINRLFQEMRILKNQFAKLDQKMEESCKESDPSNRKQLSVSDNNYLRSRLTETKDALEAAKGKLSNAVSDHRDIQERLKYEYRELSNVVIEKDHQLER